MLHKWLEMLEEFGWHTPLDEITYGTTALDQDFIKPLVIRNTEILRTPRKTGFKVLGTHLTFDNQDDVELDRRISGAWGAFHKFAPLLVCPVVPVEKRLEVLTRAVHPALFWCAGSWNLRRNQNSKLRGLQLTMLRKMLRFKRQEGEDLGDFMRRTNSIINNITARHRVARWDTLGARAVFRWASKLISISALDPTRLTSLIFAYRDWEWIQSIASQNHGRPLHGRILKTWRWERPFYKFAGTYWKQEASDNFPVWLSKEADFLEWWENNGMNQQWS